MGPWQKRAYKCFRIYIWTPNTRGWVLLLFPCAAMEAEAQRGLDDAPGHTAIDSLTVP